MEEDDLKFPLNSLG